MFLVFISGDCRRCFDQKGINPIQLEIRISVIHNVLGIHNVSCADCFDRVSVQKGERISNLYKLVCCILFNIWCIERNIFVQWKPTNYAVGRYSACTYLCHFVKQSLTPIKIVVGSNPFDKIIDNIVWVSGWLGELVERSNTSVLKTEGEKSSVSSNLTLTSPYPCG